MKKNVTAGLAVLLFLVLASMITNTGEIGMSNPSYSSSSFQVCESSGPFFDLTLMPEFADLVPSIEPVNLTLELRVGVTDPEGLSLVIGSYKNNSNSEWTNVSMSYDAISSDPDDYVAWPLNYTMSEPSFLVIWDIKFYANDSLNNWNTSSIHQMSISRQSSTGTTTTSTTSDTTSSATDTNTTTLPIIPIAIAVIFAAIILPILYVMYQRRISL